jgi:hypothetical protein
MLHAPLPSVPQDPLSQALFWQVRQFMQTLLLALQPEQSELVPQAPFPSVPHPPPSAAPQDPLVQVVPAQDES